MTTFFSSDHHYDHRNIIGYCTRPFASVEEMNERLIENWNSVVRPEDKVIYLGDFGLRGPEHLLPFRNRMNGHWELFVSGNHDRATVTHSPGFADRIIPFHASRMEPYEIDGVKVYLSHCPALSVMPDDPVNLFGHTHQMLSTTTRYPRQINIGVDAWGYYPVSWDEIKSLI